MQLSVRLIWNRGARSTARLWFLNPSLSLSLKGKWMRPKGATLSLHAAGIAARIWLYLRVNPSCVGRGAWRLAAIELQIRARQTSVQRKTCCGEADTPRCRRVLESAFSEGIQRVMFPSVSCPLSAWPADVPWRAVMLFPPSSEVFFVIFSSCLKTMQISVHQKETHPDGRARSVVSNRSRGAGGVLAIEGLTAR